MKKKIPRRQRILIITGCILVVGILNIVWHEAFVIDRTRTVIHLDSTKKLSHPVLELSGTMKVSWKKHDQHILKNNSVSSAHNFTGILILTYMRSGSSLTGEIIQQHPDTFYVFEPLHMLEGSFKAKFPIQFLNGTFIKPGKYSWEDVAIPTLQAWFNCDVEQVFIKALYDKLFLSFGKKTSLLHQCIEERNPNNTWKLYTSTWDFCVQKVRKTCLASKYRVIKTVRTSMRHVKSLLAALPHLKVIHLIRNPHETMMSQAKVSVCGNGTVEELANCTSFYCSRLNDNILVTEESSVLKNKVLTLFFENLATNPMEISEEIYKFAGMNITDNVRDSIYNLISYKSLDSCAVCQMWWQQPGNVTLTRKAFIKKWQPKMPKVFGVMVDMLCRESIIYLNYSLYGDPYRLG